MRRWVRRGGVQPEKVGRIVEGAEDHELDDWGEINCVWCL